MVLNVLHRLLECLVGQVTFNVVSALYLVLMNTDLDKDKWELKLRNQIWLGIPGQMQSNWSTFREVRFPSFCLCDCHGEVISSCSTVFRVVVRGISLVIIPPPTLPPPRLQIGCALPQTSGVIRVVFPGPSPLLGLVPQLLYASC